MLEGGAYRLERTILVQDSTAEESEAYSLTTQADPVTEAASTVGTEVATVVGVTAGAVVEAVVEMTTTTEVVEEAGRVAVTKVVFGMDGVSVVVATAGRALEVDDPVYHFLVT